MSSPRHMGTASKARWQRLRSGIIGVTTGALALALLTVPAATADTPEVTQENKAVLDVTFDGTFTENTYQKIDSEGLNGTLTRIAGTEEIVGGVVTLQGTRTGIQFTPTNQQTLSSDGATVDRPVRAEMIFTPEANQPTDSTLFSAGGNLFVRYNGNNLLYGFSSTPAGQPRPWTTHSQRISSLPEAGKPHVLRVEYLPGDTTTMKITLDGQESAIISTDRKSRVSERAKGLIGFGREVNPAGTSPQRGFTGSIQHLRLLGENDMWKLELPAAPAPRGEEEGGAAPGSEGESGTPVPQPPAAEENSDPLNVTFGGAFSNGNAYTAATGEQLKGALSRVAGTEAADDFGGLKLTGGRTGIHFVPASDDFRLSTGGADIDRHFKAEILFTPAATQRDEATVFSAGGNLFVRYSGDSLVYGFSSHSGGRWHNHTQSAALPLPERPLLIQVEYSPTNASAAEMTVWVNGKKGHVVKANARSRMASGLEKTYGFGNEVNSGGRQRGINGILTQIRLSAGDSKFVVDAPSGNNDIENDTCEFEKPKPGNTFLVDRHTDCGASIRAKLSALRPTASQADFLDAGLTAFIHYGVNTYWGRDGREWGYGDEDPMSFNPTDLDTDQWAKTLADAGFRYAVLTIKHHDGFTLYPSRYNEFGVQSSRNFEGGKGDVVRRFVDSARKHGLKVGFYVSPADSHQERLGVYANGNPKQDRSIPTLVNGDTRQGKIGTPEFPGPFTYQASDYGALFLNTLYELLTEYGSIDEVWFDGAGGNTSGTEVFDHTAYFELIRKLQPHALIAVAGPDVRWVGNEAGLSREAEWSPQAVKDNRTGNYGVVGAKHPDLGSHRHITYQVLSGKVNKLTWYPAESDVSLRPGWFFHNEQRPKSLDQLQNIYKRSFGRNSVLLLNVPPNREGKFADTDVARLQEWTRWRTDAFGSNIALGRPGSVEYPTGEGAATASTDTFTLTDGSMETFPANPYNAETGSWTVSLDGTQQIDALILSEPTRAHGQQIESMKVEVRKDGQWSAVQLEDPSAKGGASRFVPTAPAVGARRIVVFDRVYEADAVRVSVLKARGPVFLSEIHVHGAGVAAPDYDTYYVDTSAPVSGPGTIEHPIAHLDQLKQMTFKPGTKVLFKRGTTLNGQLVMWGYGTAENPVTVGFYGEGADPVLALSNSTQTTFEDVLEDLGRAEAHWRVETSATPPTGEPGGEQPADPNTGGTDQPGQNPPDNTGTPGQPETSTPEQPSVPKPGGDEDLAKAPRVSLTVGGGETNAPITVGAELTLQAPAKAGEKVNFWIHSDPLLAGTEVADVSGIATLKWRVPADFPAGDHEVFARNESGKLLAYARFTVAKAETTPPATTPDTGNRGDQGNQGEDPQQTDPQKDAAEKKGADQKKDENNSALAASAPSTKHSVLASTGATPVMGTLAFLALAGFITLAIARVSRKEAK